MGESVVNLPRASAEDDDGIQRGEDLNLKAGTVKSSEKLSSTDECLTTPPER